MFESVFATLVEVMIIVVISFSVVDSIVILSVAFTVVLSCSVFVTGCFSVVDVVDFESVKKLV